MAYRRRSTPTPGMAALFGWLSPLKPAYNPANGQSAFEGLGVSRTGIHMPGLRWGHKVFMKFVAAAKRLLQNPSM